MWKLAELDENKSYHLRLCEDERGRRHCVLACSNEPEPMSTLFLPTEKVPIDLLRRRDLELIANAVKLRNGGCFVFDAHGIWMTETEAHELAAAGWNPQKVNWAFGRVPVFAPK